MLEGRWPAVAILGFLLTAGPAEGVHVLTPTDDHRAYGPRAWLVVESRHDLRILQDGTEVRPVRVEEGFYHVRLEGLGPEGSNIDILEEGESLRLRVRGESGQWSSFHDGAGNVCGSCHRMSDSARCGECHRWSRETHQEMLSRGCERCHPPPSGRPDQVAKVCAECHPDHAGGNHPRLRHVVSAPKDPLRPSRSLDCASCHDPHSPLCLGCLGRGDLRTWCMRCHGSP